MVDLCSIHGTQDEIPISIKQTGEVTYPWTRVPSTLDMQRTIQTTHTMAHQLMNMRVHGISRLEAGMTVELQLPDIGQGSGLTSQA